MPINNNEFKKYITLVLTIALTSLSMVEINTNMSYVTASQDDSYKNQGLCMKGEKEDGSDKETFKMSCKAINFNDDDEQSPGAVSGGGDKDTGGSNDDHQTCQTCSGN